MKKTLFLTALFVTNTVLATPTLNINDKDIQGEWRCRIPYDNGKAMDYFPAKQ